MADWSWGMVYKEQEDKRCYYVGLLYLERALYLCRFLGDLLKCLGLLIVLFC